MSTDDEAQFDVGDTAAFDATFRDTTQAATDAAGLAEKTRTGIDPGLLVDPGTVALKVRTPAGVVTTYTYAAAEIVRLSVGKFRKAIVALPTAGVWKYRWEATGANAAVEPGRFGVRAADF